MSQADSDNRFIALKQCLNRLLEKYPDDEEVTHLNGQCELLLKNLEQMEDAYIDNATKLQQTLGEYSEELEKHKIDREQLLLLTKERKAVMDRANNHAQASLQILKENELLEQSVTQLQVIAKTQAEKISVLEQRLEKSPAHQDYQVVADDYAQMAARNSQFQDELQLIAQDVTKLRDQLHALSLALAAGMLVCPDLAQLARSRLLSSWLTLKKLNRQQLLAELSHAFPEGVDNAKRLLISAQPQPFADW